MSIPYVDSIGLNEMEILHLYSVVNPLELSSDALVSLRQQFRDPTVQRVMEVVDNLLIHFGKYDQEGPRATRDDRLHPLTRIHVHTLKVVPD